MKFEIRTDNDIINLRIVSETRVRNLRNYDKNDSSDCICNPVRIAGISSWNIILMNLITGAINYGQEDAKKGCKIADINPFRIYKTAVHQNSQNTIYQKM